MCDHFNEHFVNMVRPAKNLTFSPTHFQNDDTIFLSPTNELEVYRTFMGLKNSTAKDVNDIEIKPVKHVMDILVPCLVHIFNLVLCSGCFPRAMKKAKVSLFFKSGNANDPNNYRPVSILPVFSKGLEKIIYSRVNSFLCRYNIPSECQHGFQKGESTETALLTQKELIFANIEKNEMTLGIFIDFSKAFDYLNHKILLNKLYDYGIRGVSSSLFTSYLSDRQQRVAIGDFYSSFKTVSCGVPQGSILGPLLFNAYVNDIVNIPCDATFLLYADDTSLFVSGSNIEEIMLKAQKALTEVFQ